MSELTSPPPAMTSRDRIRLKDRWLALFLAWAIPGLGHFYQGRRFKATLFAVCILGTYFSGVCLGDGKVVHWTWKPDYKTYWYSAQFMTGIVALPAVIQTYRQPPQSISPDRSNLILTTKLSGPCEGILINSRIGDVEEITANIEGQIELTPTGTDRFDRSVRGKFTGVIRTTPGANAVVEDRTPIELSINSLRDIDPPIFPSPHREFLAEVEGKTVAGTAAGKPDQPIRGSLQGEVLNARSIRDRYNAPLDDTGLENAHGTLGKYFELGMMYTMIAGLLNVLAIWDAFEGPAYGYGDEDDPQQPGIPTS